ncbi:MAG: hypothetical protein AAGE92_08140, partial [Cyanobacteria bacterium P01_G01_bin.4]
IPNPIRQMAEPHQSDTVPPSAAVQLDSHVNAPVTQHSSSTDRPIASPSVGPQERQEHVPSSADTATDKAVSPSQTPPPYQPPISQQLPSSDRSTSPPSIPSSAAVERTSGETVSAPIQAQSSELSRTSQSENAIAQAQDRQQLSEVPEEYYTDRNSENSGIQQQLSDGSTTRSTPTIKVSSSDLKSPTISTIQQASPQASSPSVADVTSSPSTDFSQPQFDDSSAASGDNKQTNKNVSEPSPPAIARSVSPEAEVIQESSTPPDPVVLSPLDPSSDAAIEQQLHPISSQSSHNTGSAIQRRSTNPISSNTSNEDSPSSNESQAHYDADRRSPLPQLPRVLKPIAALKPLIQPSGSSTPTELSQATSQRTQSTNSDSLTSSEFQASSELQTGSVIQASSDSAQENQDWSSDASTSANTSQSSPNLSPPNSDSPSSSPPNQASSNQQLPLPEQWSSIADLLSEPSVSVSTSQPSTISTPPPSSSSIQAKFDRGSSGSSTIQPQWDESLSADPEETLDPETLDAYLDTLAREVYSMLRLKLERDRERNGGSYNGRLPW